MATHVGIADCNTVTHLYNTCFLSTANKPVASFPGLLLNITDGSTSYSAQLFVAWTGQAYARGKSEGTWSAWQQL